MRQPSGVENAYQFGPFLLDPAAHRLLRDGESIALPPKAFDTLVILVRRRETVVAKSELLSEVWPDSYVEENNLNQYVSMLRKTLGENGNGGPKYIETIPRLGYRFVADVQEVEAPRAPSLRSRTPWWSKARVVTASVICVVVLAAAYRVYRSSAKSSAVIAVPRTLAVMPLRNLKPDPDTDFLSIALTDAIINRLGYAHQLAVQPLGSVARYRSVDVDPRQVAQQLRVQNVLTGSYVKEGDDIRITLELIDVATNTTSWRDSMELKYEKLLTVQDRVAVSVLHSLGLELQPEELDRLRKGLPTNPVAYEYYLRATDLESRSEYEAAMKLREQSVSLEPDNAMSWALLGGDYFGYAGIVGARPVYADKGWAALQRAVTLDPGNPFIVDVMAFFLIENNKSDQAIPILRESLQHNPQDSFAHWYLSEAYRYGGALPQSIEEGELALKLNPGVATNQLFNTYLYTGEYSKFLDSLPPDEGNARTAFYRGLAYYSLKDIGHARSEFDRAHTLNPALLHSQIGHALSYATSGQPAAGLEVMKRVEQLDLMDGEMIYKMAQAYAQLGDKQSALRMLRRSVELNFHPYSYFLQDPLLQPLRTESDYRDVMELARQRQESFQQQFFGSK